MKEQEEYVSEDLEEEVHKISNQIMNSENETYSKSFIASEIDYIARHFALWQRRKDKHLIWQISSANYEKGKQEGKEQIMENAIKCEITWMDGFMLDYTQEQQDDLLEKIGVKVGDKVKLVIIKED